MKLLWLILFIWKEEAIREGNRQAESFASVVFSIVLLHLFNMTNNYVFVYTRVSRSFLVYVIC